MTKRGKGLRNHQAMAEPRNPLPAALHGPAARAHANAWKDQLVLTCDDRRLAALVADDARQAPATRVPQPVMTFKHFCLATLVTLVGAIPTTLDPNALAPTEVRAFRAMLGVAYPFRRPASLTYTLHLYSRLNSHLVRPLCVRVCACVCALVRRTVHIVACDSLALVSVGLHSLGGLHSLPRPFPCRPAPPYDPAGTCRSRSLCKTRPRRPRARSATSSRRSSRGCLRRRPPPACSRRTTSPTPTTAPLHHRLLRRHDR
jgi:hypothetical protein